MADADDDVCLSADTMAILQQFMAEQAEAKIREKGEADDENVTLSLSEDWQSSQFWYDAITCESLRAEIIRLAAKCFEHKIAKRKRAMELKGLALDAEALAEGVTVKVACLSCPSTYKALVSKGASPLPSYLKPFVFEIDPRFAVFGAASFVPYDFNRPGDWRATHGSVLEHQADIMALDPPFFNPDCLAGFAATVDLLRPEAVASSPATLADASAGAGAVAGEVDGSGEWQVPILLCTGAVMLPHARSLLGLRPCKFSIGHGQLSNAYTLYVNYEPSAILAGLDGTTGFDVGAEAAAAATSTDVVAEAGLGLAATPMPVVSAH